MFIFLLLWIIAVTIVFSFELVAGVYWYSFILQKLSLFPESKDTKLLEKSYFTLVEISSWWLVSIFSFLSGIFFGWLIESKFKYLFKTHIFWQKKQPEFYRNSSGEIRVLLPWLIFVLPLLIVFSGSIILILSLYKYNYSLIGSLIFLAGFSLGTFIELIKNYQVTIKMDRPEKPPESILQKINFNLPGKYNLFLGQIYCRVLLPLFFSIVLIIIPEIIFVIPNLNEKKLVLSISFILIGIILRWFFDKKDTFYFGKITLENILFVFAKLFSLIFLFYLSVFMNFHFLSMVLVTFFIGFILPWHPERFRN